MTIPISPFAEEYFTIFVFILFAILLSSILIFLPNILAKKKHHADKLKPYECGFEPFEEEVKKFNINFYLVAILFIIFDLEIAFLFPWAICLKKIGYIGFWSMMAFLFILLIGFIYEWRKGALEWE